jgi:hypothetical protein
VDRQVVFTYNGVRVLASNALFDDGCQPVQPPLQKVHQSLLSGAIASSV